LLAIIFSPSNTARRVQDGHAAVSSAIDLSLNENGYVAEQIPATVIDPSLDEDGYVAEQSPAETHHWMKMGMLLNL
jgi:hypothetical protein